MPSEPSLSFNFREDEEVKIEVKSYFVPNFRIELSSFSATFSSSK